MDILTIVGIVVGIGFLLVGQMLEGGHAGSLVQLTAAFIVYGGVLGSMIVQSSIPNFIFALKSGLRAFKGRPDHSVGAIKDIVKCANIVRKEGILALTPMIKELKDPFFQKGLQLLQDGTEPRMLREIMEAELVYGEEHEEVGPKFFENAGGYMPTYGIIGAVIGLIHVMENLSDLAGVGAGIAVAFVATIYGLVGANLITLPIANKLKTGIKEEGLTRQIIIEGLMSIAAGENPRLIEGKLEGFLTEANKQKMKAGAKK